ncbi:hypothetical protein [Pseudoduganella namucuonensis]|uniref:XRE family transcriptional regulator n=1 Tax=Pseudoduganella namucuonensis TaxID=1035707 RepID=A0A1I7M7X6_9BURK|nr:hypothetical protein [Pseudoduganella namucuonensis]SFV18036.1 hypothetical protein SAMN05216552_10874 [Pseudoduganella namucuonensis]
MRTPPSLLSDPDYNPNRLLDEVLAQLSLKNDAALSRSLGVSPPILSKVRHRRMPVAAWMIIQIHDATEMSIDEIRALLGVPVARRQRPAAAE